MKLMKNERKHFNNVIVINVKKKYIERNIDYTLKLFYHIFVIFIIYLLI